MPDTEMFDEDGGTSVGCYGEADRMTVEIENPQKSITIRHPSTDEWLRWSRQQKTLRRSLGRGRTVTEATNRDKAHLELIAAIKVDGEDLDPYEAQHVIGSLGSVAVRQALKAPGLYTVLLEWQLFSDSGVTVHTLKPPTVKDLMVYGRAALSVVELPHGVEELCVNLRAACDLYDKLAISQNTEGYAEGFAVPPAHKFAVVTEVRRLASLPPQPDPND